MERISEYQKRMNSFEEKPATSDVFLAKLNKLIELCEKDDWEDSILEMYYLLNLGSMIEPYRLPYQEIYQEIIKNDDLKAKLFKLFKLLATDYSQQSFTDDDKLLTADYSKIPFISPNDKLLVTDHSKSKIPIRNNGSLANQPKIKVKEDKDYYFITNKGEVIPLYLDPAGNVIAGYLNKITHEFFLTIIYSEDWKNSIEIKKLKMGDSYMNFINIFLKNYIFTNSEFLKTNIDALRSDNEFSKFNSQRIDNLGKIENIDNIDKLCIGEENIFELLKHFYLNLLERGINQDIPIVVGNELLYATALVADKVGDCILAYTIEGKVYINIFSSDEIKNARNLVKIDNQNLK
jgi:hypothetical protein